jgi:hypothetical protein
MKKIIFKNKFLKTNKALKGINWGRIVIEPENLMW